jgi:glycosyltransferase involved in cell wall biosynthesis
VKLLYLTVENMNLSKGSTVHVREIVRRLREMGCEVTLVASGNPRGEGVPVFVSIGGMAHGEGRAQRAVIMVWKLIRLFFVTNLYLPSHDLIYARDYHVAFMCVLPKLVLRRKLVYEINGLASQEWLMKDGTILDRAAAWLIERLERFALWHADKVVAVTNGLRQYLVSNFGVEEGKISVTLNGVDTRVFHPMEDSESLEDLRGCLGIQEDELAVLFAGNLAPWQGVCTLLDSIPLVLSRIPRVRFLIVGDGTLRQRLQQKVWKMDLEKKVLFTGMISYKEVPRYINLVDVCVSPFVRRRNNWIGLSPLKVYEYMACGKAVVSSRVAGLDFIEKKGAGILVEPENPEALAQGIVSLLLDPPRRARMGQSGARLAKQELDWEIRAREVLQTVKNTADRMSFCSP